MSPRMRPSPTERSTPSSAMALPKAFRRPRASMQGTGSALLTRGGGGAARQLLRKAKPLDGRPDFRPLFAEEPLALAPQQQVPRAGVDEHAAAPLLLDEPLVDKLLVGLEHRERIDPAFGRDIAHRRQRIAFLEQAVADHGDHPLAHRPVHRLTVVPLLFHFPLPLPPPSPPCAILTPPLPPPPRLSSPL